MARLTRLQLRAIFAKMGRMRFMKGRTSARLVASLGDPKWRLQKRHTDFFVSRLPKSHREMADVKAVVISKKDVFQSPSKRLILGTYENGKIRMASGWPAYQYKSGHNPKVWTHVPKGRVLKFDTKADYISPAAARRNAFVGSAKTFYHEYAHAIIGERGYADAVTSKSGITTKGQELVSNERWQRILVHEWLQKDEVVEPLDVVLSPTAYARTFRGGYRWMSFDEVVGKPFSFYKKLRPTVDPEEAWSEAYAMYATSKSSRNQMKRELPATWQYLREFFGG